MSVLATVNYHVHSDVPQAYHIDAGGIKGEIISPEHDIQTVLVRDTRTDEAKVSFGNDSVGFLNAPTQVENFETDQAIWQQAYDRELSALLRTELRAREVIVFDHTVRIDDPESNRKPARNVHSDYSPDGAANRLVDIVGSERAADWSKGRYSFVNVWRPVGHVIETSPLGFVRPKSVRREDWITLKLIYPDRLGEIMGLTANPAHEWIYRSRMSPDEVAIFNIFDNGGQPSVGHSALDLVSSISTDHPRKSVESRTLIRY